VTNGYSATGYELAIRDEKDKSSMGFEIVTLRICKCRVSVCLEIYSSLFIYTVKNDTGIRSRNIE